MRTLERHPDIYLPSYDSDEVRWTFEDLADLRHSNSVRAIRFVKLDAPGFDNLTDVLLSADEAFAEVAQFCGTSVLRHTWGLSELPRSMTPDMATYLEEAQESAKHLLPAGKVLVAEVDVVRDQEPLDSYDTEAIRQGLNQHILGTSKAFWYDGEHCQFVKGSTADTNKRQLTLVDIEPRISLRGGPVYS